MHQPQDDLYTRLSSAVEELDSTFSQPAPQETYEDQCGEFYRHFFYPQWIQEQVSQGTDVIWNCGAVDKLCYCMEDIFSHGLREGLLSWASNSEVSFWSLAMKITCKKDIEDIIRLNLKSDREKCMCWIRQGLKENTLGSYINVITQDERLLREFYHSYAFLCDEEKAETVKNLITYGISHLDFDISLSSSTRRPMAVEATPVLAPDMMIGHLPLRNGYTSPSNSLNVNRNLTHNIHKQEAADMKSEETGKKRRKKKRSRAGVAMIAESVDAEESSKYIEKVMEMHRDFDSQASEEEAHANLENSMTSSEQKHNDDGKNQEFEQDGDHSETSISHPEDSLSGISLTMELPVSETMLHVQQIIADEKRKDDSDSIDSLVQDLGSTEEVSSMDAVECSQHEEEMCSDKKAVSHVESFDDNLSNATLEASITNPKESSILQQNDTNHEQGNMNDVIPSPSQEGSPPSTQDSSSDALPHSSKSSTETDQETVTAEGDTVCNEHHVALATFECGTPKQIDDISEIERDRGLSCTSYEEEDFNIVPGIHKSNGRLSRSGSSGSFTGSGSFQLPSQRNSRNNTMDSIYRSSTFGSSAASDSWKHFTNSLPGSSRKSSRADVGTGSPGSEDHFSEYELFDELLGLEEDHFSPPESFMGVSTSEELEHAIQSCKDLINTTSEDSEEKQRLVNKLVQLRLKLQEAQDSGTEQSNSDVRRVLGHMFIKEEEPGNKLSCDKCGKTIWMWQSLFTCKACNYHSHRRCLDMIRRPCASRKVSVSTYNLEICPETGLSSQQYKCAECRKQIGLTKGERCESRLCDYTGQYFCEECHWNDLVVIPARVVHNWDFASYRVSRQAKQLLALMLSRPLLKIERLNPALFKFVVELREVKRLREEILIMKKYFMTCREALESKLLLQLKDRQHFVDSANVYSLQDLIDVNMGSLLPFVTKIHSLFLTHIKSDCQLCRAKGFVCELCQSDEVIFAFDPHASQCTHCRSVYHKTCFKAGICPKCERRQKRAQSRQ